jgi:hypothetical protein
MFLNWTIRRLVAIGEGRLDAKYLRIDYTSMGGSPWTADIRMTLRRRRTVYRSRCAADVMGQQGGQPNWLVLSDDHLEGREIQNIANRIVADKLWTLEINDRHHLADEQTASLTIGTGWGSGFYLGGPAGEFISGGLSAVVGPLRKVSR